MFNCYWVVAAVGNWTPPFRFKTKEMRRKTITVRVIEVLEHHKPKHIEYVHFYRGARGADQEVYKISFLKMSARDALYSNGQLFKRKTIFNSFHMFVPFLLWINSRVLKCPPHWPGRCMRLLIILRTNLLTHSWTQTRSSFPPPFLVGNEVSEWSWVIHIKYVANWCNLCGKDRVLKQVRMFSHFCHFLSRLRTLTSPETTGSSNRSREKLGAEINGSHSNTMHMLCMVLSQAPPGHSNDPTKIKGPAGKLKLTMRLESVNRGMNDPNKLLVLFDYQYHVFSSGVERFFCNTDTYVVYGYRWNQMCRNASNVETLSKLGKWEGTSRPQHSMISKDDNIPTV